MNRAGVKWLWEEHINALEWLQEEGQWLSFGIVLFVFRKNQNIEKMCRHQRFENDRFNTEIYFCVWTL